MTNSLLWSAVLPAVIVLAVTLGAAAYALTSGAPIDDPVTVTVLSSGLVLSVAVVVIGAVRARRVAQDIVEMSGSMAPTPMTQTVTLSEDHVQSLLSQWERGERLHLDDPQAASSLHHTIVALERNLNRIRQSATAQVVRTAADEESGHSGATAEHRVGVFVNLARRLQSLVHREIQLLDDLEAQVEDPDMLKGLFAVDHLATRIRRHAENLAVLGGAVPRRQWSRPVNIYAVLRSAVAEVEQYSRVKLVRPFDGTLQGHAIADVVHLVAELVENATQFSAPHTQVLLRAEAVTAGLAVEVEDRGLGMPREEQNRINTMMADPSNVSMDDLLEDGRIGLFVVSTLARRHGIAVQLSTNIYGGTQSVVVLPPTILGSQEATEQITTKAVANQPQEISPVTPASPVTANLDSMNRRPTDDTVQTPIVSQEQRHTDRRPRPVAGAGQDSSPRTVVPEARSPENRYSPGPQAATHAGPRPYAGVPNPQNPSSIAASMSTEDDFSSHAKPGNDDRPQLPKRRQQSHLAPELAATGPTEPAASAESSADHDPGLMAAFQKGYRRAGHDLGDQPGRQAE